jgi:hypothetical protein
MGVPVANGSRPVQALPESQEGTGEAACAAAYQDDPRASRALLPQMPRSGGEERMAKAG